MKKINTYSVKGVKGTAVAMPKAWQEDKNLELLAQAIRVYESKRHPGLSKVKTRGEVAYSTRKIYRQKGTGGARHGGRGAPIFVKGGVAHGPKGVKRKLELSKKMRLKALCVALTTKASEGKLLFVKGLSKLKKTKETANLISALIKKEDSIDAKSRFTFALSEKNKDASMFVRNIENVNVSAFRNINAYKVYLGGVLVVDFDVLTELKEPKKTEKPKKKVAKKSAKKVTKKK